MNKVDAFHSKKDKLALKIIGINLDDMPRRHAQKPQHNPRAARPLLCKQLVVALLAFSLLFYAFNISIALLMRKYYQRAKYLLLGYTARFRVILWRKSLLF